MESKSERSSLRKIFELQCHFQRPTCLLVLQGSMCVRFFICLDLKDDLNNWRRVRDESKGGEKENGREGVNGQNFIVARFAEFRTSRRHSSRIDAGSLHWQIRKDFPDLMFAFAFTARGW